MPCNDGRSTSTTLGREPSRRSCSHSQWEQRSDSELGHQCVATVAHVNITSVYTPLEQVVVHEIYGTRIAINVVVIKCETDKLSDNTS